MANKLTSDVIQTQRHRRNFIQFGGALPNARTQYAGQDTQYISIRGVTLHDTGAINPVWVPDAKVQGGYQLVNRQRTAPALPTATVVLHEAHKSLPWQLFRQGCQFTLYENAGVCQSLEDFDNGWNDYKLVYSNALVTDKGLGDRSGWDTDNAIEDSLTVTLENVYPIGQIDFANKAAVAVTLKVEDVVYGTQIRCAECGVPNDGTNFIYAVQDATGSAGAKPQVIYSLDAGLTWTALTITTAAAGETVCAIDIVGDKLVVVSPTGGTSASALYWSQLNTVTGAPSSTFAKVNLATATATNKINDIYVASASEVFFCGDNGYLYRSNDITGDVIILDAGSATSNALARITGLENTLVAVGASGTVIKSLNRGTTWAVTTTSPGSGTSSAIAVLSDFRFWYGNSAGAVYQTIDGGETWTVKTIGGATMSAVEDIVFATQEVGYIAYLDTTLKLATTMNGGWSWVNSSQVTPRIAGWPSIGTGGGRVAVPSAASDAAVAANNVAVGGLGATTDGFIFVGTALKK